MKRRCPYCFTETETQRGLHSHMMQKKSCRENMEADAATSETDNKRNSSDSPLSPTQHTNDMLVDESSPSGNEMDFEMDRKVSGSPGLQDATATIPQPPSSSNLETVEHMDASAEDADVDDASETRWIEEFPYPAGIPIGEGVSCFEKWRRDQKKRNEPPWSPFKSREEWELARWLITSGVSQRKIDALLELKMVRLSRNIMNTGKSLTIKI